MSLVSMLTYAIALTPENAGKIDAINRIMLGETYAASAPIESAKTAVESKPTKTADKPADKPAAKEKVKPQEPDLTEGATMDDLKSAAKKAKADHGEDFVKAAIEASGVKCLASLGRTMVKIEPENYETMIATWQAGPQAADDDLGGDDLDDDLGGDDLDDDLGEEAPTPEAVKLALKAMSQGGDRAGAKKLMSDNGAEKLSDVDNCTPTQLATMFKALV